MARTVELHIVQSWPASFLHAGEHGQCEETWFGGVRRIRVPWQALKRAQRRYLCASGLVLPGSLGVRTKRLPTLLTAALADAGHPPNEARDLAICTVWGMGVLDLDARTGAAGQTKVPLLVADNEVVRVADLVHERAADLRAHLVPAHGVLGIGQATTAAAAARRGPSPSSKRRQATCPAVFKDLGRRAYQRLDPTRAVDVALFGPRPDEQRDVNVDGAADIAHAISVHEAGMDVSNLAAGDGPAASDGRTVTAHLSRRVLSGPVLYRHAAVDVGLLAANLCGDPELIDLALRAWTTAAVYGQPADKHASTPPWPRPPLILAVAREDGPLSLANAFINPLRPTVDADVTQVAAAALAQHWHRVEDAYGHDAVSGVWHTWVGGEPNPDLPGDGLPACELLNRAVRIATIGGR